MKATFLRWSSIVTGFLSAAWVVLLAALVARCLLAEQPFPVLAKFSRFRGHLVATDRMLDAFPLLALLAVAFTGIAWYRERTFRPVRTAAIAVGVSILISILVIAVNPGGYLSWFLS
jgi:hypothetical protein